MKNVSFHKSDQIEVKFTKKTKVDIQQFDQILSISSEDEAKISLYLPENKKYLYETKDGTCTFDNETLNFDSDDAFVVISEDGLKVVDYSDGSEVLIDDSGLYVKSQNETVSITDEGINVEGSETVKITGPFGALVGLFVKGVTNVALNSMGRTPAKVFKFLVNHEDDENGINFYRR